jgi:hypothetical protein
MVLQNCKYILAIWLLAPAKENCFSYCSKNVAMVYCLSCVTLKHITEQIEY